MDTTPPATAPDQPGGGEARPKVALQWSPAIDKLAAALAKAQGAMDNAKADSANPHFKSTYADLASASNACRRQLAEVGIAVIQAPSAKGREVTVGTLLAHSSGQWVFSSLTLTADKDSPQAIGSAITYARRYVLMAMVNLAPEDDDGNAASPVPQRAAPPPDESWRDQTPVAKKKPDGRALARVPSPQTAPAPAHQPSHDETAMIQSSLDAAEVRSPRARRLIEKAVLRRPEASTPDLLPAAIADEVARYRATLTGKLPDAAVRFNLDVVTHRQWLVTQLAARKITDRAALTGIATALDGRPGREIEDAISEYHNPGHLDVPGYDSSTEQREGQP